MKNLIRRLADKIQNYNSKFKIFIFCLVILFSTFLFLNFIYAATNIDSTYRYGWNDLIGWIDFYSTNNVYVYFDRIKVMLRLLSALFLLIAIQLRMGIYVPDRRGEGCE